VQPGVHAALSRRRSRVQIPSGPLGVAVNAEVGRVAQLVERAPEKREVTGSTPVSTTEKERVNVDAFDGARTPPTPVNEVVREYAPGSPERFELQQQLASFRAEGPREFPMVISGVDHMASGAEISVVEPHAHQRILGVTRESSDADVARAIDGALAAAAQWRALSLGERSAIFLRAAALLAGPWRARINAATMLGQSKSAYQAEIDAACEMADFFRFAVADAHELYERQPRVSPEGVRNELDYRPLEGFVLAITPFNFTAIAANLACAPALMGNTVLWKPSATQQFSASLTMSMLQEAGLPPGVINLVTGNGEAVSRVALAHPKLAGIHFTGSTATFRRLWRSVADHLDSYVSYPRLVGETGGKDFVVAHSSAATAPLVTALVRGAFDYQGQKCSAASRAYLPASLARGVLDDLVDTASSLTYGDVTDFTNYGGAVIDRRSFDRLADLFDRLKNDPTVEILTGAVANDRDGFFIAPTVLSSTNPHHEIFTTEFFGPVLSVYTYADNEFDATLQLVDSSTPYALTGALFARDQQVIASASSALRYSAGNFYVNDKPTGAVVGQQPFGGSRASGTNDKAGSILNLERWVSARTIKETYVAPTAHRYAHQAIEEA
jgi:1-pyrroline-5-carboxylate dehydrogenase